MYSGLCHTSSSAGSLGNIGAWGWIGTTLYLVALVGLLAGLALLVVFAVRRARVPSTVLAATGQLTGREILQAQYARGEITREQYEQKKQDVG